MLQVFFLEKVASLAIKLSNVGSSTLRCVIGVVSFKSNLIKITSSSTLSLGLLARGAPDKTGHSV